MGDLAVKSPLTDGQLGVNGHDINNVTGTASINPDFALTKPSKSALSDTDQLLVLQADNIYQRYVTADSSVFDDVSASIVEDEGGRLWQAA